VRRLEELGVLERYSAIVNRRAVGLELLCFVQVSLAHHRPGSVKRFPHVIATMPEVLECHYLTGEVDYLLKVVVPTHEHLERFVFDRLMKVPGVDRIRTSIALREVKASAPLPL
jgi:Lrp/AsnC family transcriptional regulator, leucine-responsive regulatory protein